MSREHLKKPPINNNVKVETELEAIRERNRLAIHCFESASSKNRSHLFPEIMLGELQKHPHCNIATNILGKYVTPTLSLTLLPSGNNSTDVFSGNTAYLFDLTQDKVTSPPVIRAFPYSGWTYYNNFNKNLHLGNKREEDVAYSSFASEIYGAYDPLSERAARAKFRKAVAHNPIDLSNKQLDALADNLQSADKDEGMITHFNEVIAGVRKEHIKAIAVPYKTEERMPYLSYLKGALSGLAHLQHGINLPVVLYRIGGPQSGECEYVAQGQEECRKVAIDSIRTLQACGMTKDMDYLHKDCRRFLGIDIHAPVDAQIGKSRN